MTKKELANVLEQGLLADIWYDAKAYHDTSAALRIAETKFAMRCAINMLRRESIQ